MSPEILRRAAALMRERAEAATPGPWRDVPMGSEGSVVLNGGNTIHTARKPATCREFADAEHIASWHPAVALAVADWLDVAARDLWAHGTDCYAVDHEPCWECDDDLAAPHVRAALAVARAYLGEGQ